MDPAELSELIAAVYDCALDSSLWPETLERVSAVIGAVHGAVRVLDPRTRELRLNVTWGGTEHWTRLYNETFYALVPTLPNQLQMELDVTLSTSDMMPRSEFNSSRFYHEWAKPQGYEDVAGCLFIKQPDRVAWNSYYLPRALKRGDDSVKQAVSLLAPHFRRAALIGDLLEMRAIEAREFRAIVDKLTFGVFLVDAECRLLHANRAGEEVIHAGAPLRAAQNRLAATDPKVSAALARLVAALGEDGTAMSRGGTSMPCAFADGRPAVLHILPQRTGSRRARIDGAAVAALFLSPQTAGPPTWRETTAALFDLSPAELRILAPLVEGKAAGEIATELSLSEPTIRTHLRALYSKTGTSRQGELIALVHSLSLPLLARDGPS